MSSHAFAVEHIEQTLKKEGRIQLSAIGFSMLPLIHPGQRIEVVSSPVSEIKPGDIVLVKKNNSFILHRVHAVPRNGSTLFITKGDNTDRYDEPVSPESITGKVISVGNWVSAKIFWRGVNKAAILFSVQIPQWHKRLAEMRWYKALIHAKNRVVGRKALIAPLVKKTSSLIPWLAEAGQRAKAKKNSFKLTLLLPKTHFLEIGADGPVDKILSVWDKSFPDLHFDSPSALKYNLFSHPLADNPLVFVAERKNRCLGFLSGVRRFPDTKRKILCSVEALAVDPDSRRRGLGSSLLEVFKNKCRNCGASYMMTSRNYLFFTGLHPEQHEQAILFFVKNGFGAPLFLNEMFVSSKNIVSPPALKAAEKYCALEGFSFQRLQEGDERPFLAFLDTGHRELYGRCVQKKWRLGEISENEGFLLAKHGQTIVGFARYDRLQNRTGPADFYRQHLAGQWVREKPGKIFILSELFLSKEYRGKGVGDLFVKTLFDTPSKFGCEGFLFDTLRPNFFRRFGAHKIAQYLKFGVSLTVST